MDINLLTVESTRTAISEKQFTAAAVVDAFYEKIRKDDPDTGAYLTLSEERAYMQAARIDELAGRGEALPPLAGVPIAVKDVISTKGVRTTAGSKILANYNAPYNATVVDRLENAGAIILGKTNCDEFAMGSSNENSGFHPVRNPRDRTRVPGGSSGGSAAVVAAGTAVASLGTDTGGSIRQPASFCGVVGMMPTYGRVSRYGLIAFASSLDKIGPFGKTVKDTALLLQVMAGRDPMDSTSADVPVPNYSDSVGHAVGGLKIGVPSEYFGEGLDEEVRSAVEAAIQKLAEAGCEIVPISLKHTAYAIPTYYLVATAEASANLARFDGVRYGVRAKDAKTLSEMYRRTRDEGFGAGGEAAHHAGHIRAEFRLLRRLLPESSEGSHADHARLRRGIRQGRCHRYANNADGGVPAGRKSGRSVGDVSGRHLHRDREPGGDSGIVGAVRQQLRRAADWITGAGQALR